MSFSDNTLESSHENKESLNPALIYEEFMGFPLEEAHKFFNYCRQNIKFPDLQESELRKNETTLQILSIGTGYGRADFPIIRSFIEHYENKYPSSSFIFNINCIDPSDHFQGRLKESLKNNCFNIYSDQQFSLNEDRNNLYCVEGKGRAGSVVKIHCHKMTFEDYINKDQDNYYFIIGSLAFQFIKNLKSIFALLLEKLRENGVIIIGEVCEQGAWISEPPPPIFDGDAKYRDWFDLWTDWHKILQVHAISRRVRLFMPHNFYLLSETLEELGFKRLLEKENDTYVFNWSKELGLNIFSKIKHLIENRGWENSISAFHIPGKCVNREGKQVDRSEHIIDHLTNQVRIDELKLSGKWSKEQGRFSFVNGLRFHIFSKPADDKEKKTKEDYLKVLQRNILENSYTTLRAQGLFSNANSDLDRELIDPEDKETELFDQFTLSLYQHLEIDEKAFVTSMSVLPVPYVLDAKRARSSNSGHLIPLSCEDNKQFFDDLFNIKNNSTSNDNYTPIQCRRIWLWLEMLYLFVGEGRRPSYISKKIKDIFNLESQFNLIISMGEDEEDIIEVQRNLLYIHLNRNKFVKIRKIFNNYLNGNQGSYVKTIINEVMDWNNNGQAVLTLKEFWGEQSSLVMALKEGTAFPDSFTLAPGKEIVFKDKENIKISLFGRDHENLRDTIINSSFDLLEIDSPLLNKLSKWMLRENNNST